MRHGRAPRTDIGTIVLHWPLAIFLVIAAVTGLRIASDEPGLEWLRVLDTVLPRNDLWYWHLIGGLGFSALLVAYLVYIAGAKLSARVHMDKTRVSMVFRRGRERWVALGVIVLWAAFGAAVAEILSGFLIFLGFGGWALVIHRNMLWICLAFPVLHVALHLAYGGINQLLRVFRPSPLVLPPPEPDVLELLAEHIQLVDALKQGRSPEQIPTPERAPTEAWEPEDEAPTSVVKPLHPSMPLFGALLAGGITALAGLGLQKATETTLLVSLIEQMDRENVPVIDGDISDPIWSRTRPASVLTNLGANFENDSGESRVTVRAAYDAENLYMAISWDDPTRSLMHLPLVKNDTGWHLVRKQGNLQAEEDYHADQFSVLLAAPAIPVVGSAIHLSPQPLADYPASASGRGMHFTQGGIADVWVWRASHGGAIGMLEDAHFTAPLEPTPAQRSGKEPYRGGFDADAADDCIEDNFNGAVSADANATIEPKWLPRSITRMAEALGLADNDASASEAVDARWWMGPDEVIAYSPEADAALPPGTVIPSIVITCTPTGDSADVTGVAGWAAGRWTLELVRRLETGSVSDLPLASGTMLWLAAFDHAATRHTRHTRPIILDLQQ